jgi:superfamily II DNA or RNA helicase
MMSKMFEKLAFRFPFRKYQHMILDQVVLQQTDRKYHIVAPPGAGKTIIGLDLIRRFGAPAVVFAPTTTIQAQWFEKLGMFVQPPEDAGQYASTDPSRLAPIQFLTYQVISTSSDAQLRLHEAGLVLWQEELIREGQVPNLEAAQARLETIRRNNPDSYHREMLRFAKRVKHKLLHEPDANIEHFLHPNALRLIDALVAHGVKTVVLDECHHLLDYWAVVLRHLISRIANPQVVGLTATLPSPEGDDEYENYNSLLGEVDFEIPTPAVVKEGDLAPYRDLAYIVKPTSRELEYLNRIQAEFELAISGLKARPRFVEWVKSLVSIPPEAPGPEEAWQKHWDEHPMLTLAAVRFLRSIGQPPSPSLVTPVEAQDPLDLEDWSNLLERFGLDVLKTSPDAEDHALLRTLRKAIQPFGMTLTERGMSQARSPGDLVLTFSEAKDFAVAHILKAETQAMGDRLRVAVVTDFERLGTGIRQLKGVLDPDAGSAVRLFCLLASRSEIRCLAPTLVTGSTLMIPAASAGKLLEFFSRYLKEQALDAVCSIEPASVPEVAEVIGSGSDWTPGNYVRMVTAAFERGDIKCLIGTRGIFGEGWDSLKLNTLIDLTSVTTSTAVQQLRGRTLRLDPDWPRKVAHNWDVVCIAPRFERGNSDFLRFMNRHKQYWSLVIYPDWLERRETPDGKSRTPPHLHGKVAKGIVHVSPYLIASLLNEKDNLWQSLGVSLHNRRTMRQVPLRDQVYDLWGIGEDYSNFSYAMSSLDARDLKIKTVFTLQNTLRALLRDLLTSIITVVFTVFYYGWRYWVGSINAGLATFLLCSIVFFGLVSVLTISINGRKIYAAARSLFVEQLPDAILLDVGRALLEALRASGLVSRHLNADFVRAIRNDDDSYNVLLDYASSDDSATFIQAYREIFEPIRDQRYLIMRTEDRLPSLPLQLLWLPLRRWVRTTGMYPPAYYPVPKVLSTRRERVDLFAKAWSRYVGGGEVVFTRSEAGRAVLLSARAQRRPNVRQQAFETWR